MADLPFALSAPLAARLDAVLDIEGKIPRALVSLGSLAGREAALVDAGDGRIAAGLREAGVVTQSAPLVEPFRLDVPDGGLDAVVALWNGFRGIAPAELAEADRALRPGGRLLVVHEYGRDDVSALRPADAPEYTTWSRRDGPFLRGGFRIHVVHCFWTFETVQAACSFLDEAFGEPGRALGATLHRPRVRWNVAIYHRERPAEVPAAAGAAIR